MFNINVGLCPILSQRQRDRRVNILWQVSWYAWWLRWHCGTGKSVAISGPSKNESMFCGDLPWKKWPSWRRYARYLQWIGPLKWPCQAARRLDKCWGSLEHHEVQQPLISSSPNILFWLVVAANPSEKWWSSSVGMMKFPTEWGKKHGSKPPTSFYIFLWCMVSNIYFLDQGWDADSPLPQGQVAGWSCRACLGIWATRGRLGWRNTHKDSVHIQSSGNTMGQFSWTWGPKPWGFVL